MLNVTDKSVNELKKIMKGSSQYSELKDKGQEVYIRLNAIDEDKDFAYTFEFSTELNNEKDVLMNFGGLGFIYPKERNDIFSKTEIDFGEEDGSAGFIFKTPS